MKKLGTCAVVETDLVIYLVIVAGVGSGRLCKF